MILTRKQEEGLRKAVERYRAGEPYTCIAGYAGTGKSTLVRFIVDALGFQPEEVCYVAFTGKAATVLQQKGCPNATTAHKLLYKAYPLPNGGFRFKPLSVLEQENCKLIVVDEISMLPKPLWDLLLTHKVYILALGDPGQLPPIYESHDNHVLDNPHIFLDEVMRQAQDSEIIRLSMHIRDNRPISTFECAGQQVKIFNSYELDPSMYSWADQILCATNEKRNEINKQVRDMKGFNILPQAGDKIISLSNHWNDFSENGWALTNGAIGTIINYSKESIKIPYYLCKKPYIDYMYTTFQMDNGDIFSNAPIDYHYLITGTPTLTDRQIYQFNKNQNLPEAPWDFAYAYAITTHKAQGSEWGKVLVVEETYPTARAEHQRWMYTAVTRASEKLVVIKK